MTPRDDIAPVVSVVIPARNAANTLGDQLAALVRQFDGSFEVMVVDNASTDDTAAVAHSFADRLPISVVHEPLPGTNRARNTGVRAARADKILLTDADDVVADQWVRRLSAPLHEGVWVAGELDLTVLNSQRTRRLRQYADRHGSGEATLTIGCNCGFTTSDWVRAGGFDERLSGQGDETEFFIRLHRLGLSGVFVPEAVVHYRLRTGMRRWLRDQYGAGAAHARLLQYGVGDRIVVERPTAVWVARALVHLALLVVDVWSFHRRGRRLGAAVYYASLIVHRRRSRR